MSLVLNTNISSLTAQRNLTKSQSALSTAMSRLSSGLRINSAADDAAGMAIASRMTTQVNGLDQASRNANDAISLSQTAEGALNELSSNLQRIRELAVQAANDTNSDSDRAALDQEVQQRLSEVNRIATTTSFNGRSVLDGTFGSATFQVGANANQTISISLTADMKTSSLGSLAQTSTASSVASLFTTTASAAVAAVYTTGSITGTTDYSGSGAAKTFTVGGNAVTLDQNYTNAAGVVSAIQTQLGSGYVVAAGTGGAVTITAATAGAAGNATLAVAGTDSAWVGGSLTTTGADAVSANSGLTLASGELTIADGSGTAVDLAGTYDTSQDLADAINSKVSGVHASIDSSGKLSLTSADSITVGGTKAGTGTGNLGFTTGTTAVSGNLRSVDVLTADDATLAIQKIDSALKAVNDFTSTLGAIENRFQSAINSTEATSENLTAAKSRIEDADFASETSKMTSANILQQAGVSVLAQANSSQQSILKLLQ